MKAWHCSPQLVEGMQWLSKLECSPSAHPGGCDISTGQLLREKKENLATTTGILVICPICMIGSPQDQPLRLLITVTSCIDSLILHTIHYTNPDAISIYVSRFLQKHKDHYKQQLHHNEIVYTLFCKCTCLHSESSHSPCSMSCLPFMCVNPLAYLGRLPYPDNHRNKKARVFWPSSRLMENVGKTRSYPLRSSLHLRVVRSPITFV